MSDNYTLVELGKETKRDRDLVKVDLLLRDGVEEAIQRVRRGDVIEEIDLEFRCDGPGEDYHTLNYDGDEETTDLRRVFFRELNDAQDASVALNVYIEVYDNEHLQDDDAFPLIQGMVAEWSARYPNLSPRLGFHCFCVEDIFDGMTLPLAARLNQITTIPLQILRLSGIHFTRYDDFETLGSALARHTGLTELRFYDCDFSEIDVSALSMAIFKAPNLQTLMFCPTAGDGYLQRQELTSLVANAINANSLKVLDVGMAPMELDLMAFFEATQQSRAIQELHLSTLDDDVDTKNVHHIAKLLENNCTSLNVFCLEYDAAGAVSFEPVALALRSNTNLRHLNLGKVPKTDVDMFQRVLDDCNYTLGSLSLELESICSNTQTSLDRIDFLLKLNRVCQRKRLLAPDANSTDDDWKEVIMGCKDDVSATFYYLSKKPSIILGSGMQSWEIESVKRKQEANDM